MTILVLCGVSGSGKTTIGEAFAAATGWRFLDADGFHPAANKEKMRSGTPLTDADRMPWIDAIRSALREIPSDDHAVLAFSGLRRAYRDRLRADLPAVVMVLLEGSFETIEARILARRHEFMNPNLLRSQFQTLEAPGADEGVVSVKVDREIGEIVEELRSLV